MSVDAITDPAKFKLQFVVFFLPTAFDDDMGKGVILFFFLQKLVERFEAKSQGQVVWIGSLFFLVLKTCLVDHATDEDEVTAFDNASEIVQKPLFVSSALESEIAFLLPNLVFMEDDMVMSKLIEFE